MRTERKNRKSEPKYPNDIFRVSHREMDLCHQISEESVSNSSFEDQMGGNEKVEWLYKEKLERLKSKYIM